MTASMTADAFATLLRAAGCRVQIDRSFTGAVYLNASKPGDGTTVTIVFEDNRFKRAFAVWLGTPRRRWPKFRTMRAVRSFLGAQEAGR